jgi:hypothetical protein
MREDDFFTKFAKAHWRVEAKQFLPLPPPQVAVQTQSSPPRTAIKQITNKHQTKVRMTFELM